MKVGDRGTKREIERQMKSEKEEREEKCDSGREKGEREEEG